MNHRSLFWQILGAAAMVAAASPLPAALTDTAAHVPPSYFDFLPPQEGSSYADPVFGTSIRRLTDALVTPDATGDASFLTWAMNEYSTVAAWNSDDTRFLLQHDSYFALYDGQGAWLRDLPFEIHAGAQPRWSRSSPDVLYYVSGNRVKRFDVSSGQSTLLRTFSEYSSVSGHGESDTSFAGDKLVLAGDGRQIFVYDVAANAKSAVLDTSGLGGWDGIHLTPDGNVLVSWYASGAGRYRGLELYSGAMVFKRQVSTVIGHLDLTRDATGAEVLVYANANDLTPLCDNGVVKVRLSDSAETCLVSLDWSLALHVSCPDGDGTCLVSTYTPSDPDPAQRWPAYADELFRVSLAGGTAPVRYAHHRSRAMNDYNYAPRATVSRDGRKVLFASNFGLQDTLGLPVEYADAYLIDLGSGGTPPPPPPPGDDPPPPAGPTRIEESASTPAWAGTWWAKSGAVHSGGTAKSASTKGASVKLTFTGTGVQWVGYRDASSGIARVFLDGSPVARIDTYAASAQGQKVLYQVGGLAPGSHKLEIRVLGSKQKRSKGTWVWVDAFDVTP
jgi:hypothetical protein